MTGVVDIIDLITGIIGAGGVIGGATVAIHSRLKKRKDREGTQAPTTSTPSGLDRGGRHAG